MEKSKRDQVVSELRIMKSHALGARWLVAMHNAFYEEAKVYTVLEMMDAGSLEDLVKTHAPAGGLSDEYELAHIAREVIARQPTWHSSPLHHHSIAVRSCSTG